MTLEQLRVFVAVAEQQHVTPAANELHLAQSAVSASITKLAWEHESGCSTAWGMPSSWPTREGFS